MGSTPLKIESLSIVMHHRIEVIFIIVPYVIHYKAHVKEERNRWDYIEPEVEREWIVVLWQSVYNDLNRVYDEDDAYDCAEGLIGTFWGKRNSEILSEEREDCQDDDDECDKPVLHEFVQLDLMPQIVKLIRIAKEFL